MSEVIVRGIVLAVFVLVSFFLGYMSLRKYIGELVNHENAFYWGFSFLIMGCMNFIQFIGIFVDLGVTWIILIKVMKAISWWLQLFALGLSVFCRGWCFNSEIKTTCKVCERKKVRVTMWSALVGILILSFYTSLNYLPTVINVDNLALYSITGNVVFDVTISVIKACIAISTYMVLRRSMNFINLKMAYIMLFLAQLCFLLSLFIFGYEVGGEGSNFLYQIQWALEVTAMIAISTYVYKIHSDK